MLTLCPCPRPLHARQLVTVKAAELSKAADALDSLRRSSSEEVAREIARADARRARAEVRLMSQHEREVTRLRAGVKLCMALGIHAKEADEESEDEEDSRDEAVEARVASAEARAARAEARAEKAERSAGKAAAALEAEKQRRATLVAALQAEHQAETARLRAVCKLIFGLGLRLDDRPKR